jgi:hypothetical protein
MSKISLLSGLLVVIAAGTGYFLFHATHGKEALSSSESSVLLYVEEGDVSYRNPDMGTYQKATTSPTVLADGAKVATGLGTATILFPDNSSARLDHYTELTVSYKKDSISIFQTAGTTYHRVEAVVTGGKYEVETPGTLAAVRGTKFAVKYDKSAKTTKVAVTEHKVEVTKFDMQNGTTTEKVLEQTLLEEGKTVRVHENVQGTSTSRFEFVETNADADMKVWVDQNKGRDVEIDTIKHDIPSKDDARVEIKKTITEGKVDTTKDETKVQSEKPKDTKDVKSENPPKETTPKKDDSGTKPAQSDTSSSPVKKLDEEAFFTKFDDLFFDYFYLDDKDSTCNIKVTPQERVRVVTSYAVASGYPLQSSALLDFATAIDQYCGNKDASVKAKLQTRFDTDYPFQESI